MEDFDGWEVLPDEGYLQIHDDGGKRIYSRSYGPGPGSRCVYKDYFICPDSTSTKFVENTEQQEQEQEEEESETEYPKSRLVSIQPRSSPSPDHDQKEDLKVITEAPFEKTIINQSPASAPAPPLLLMMENLKETEESDPDPDPVLQVMYKKVIDPEFVDMKKIESPATASARSMKPPPFPIDEVKGEIFDIKKISSMKVEEEKMIITHHHSASGRNNHNHNHNNGGGGFNIWKWSLTTGIGAICSFGIATATVCIIFFGTTHHRDTTKQQQSKEKRKLQFHIYSDEKKQKEAAGGTGKGHITVGGGGGGYYDQLFE